MLLPKSHTVFAAVMQAEKSRPFVQIKNREYANKEQVMQIKEQ